MLAITGGEVAKIEVHDHRMIQSNIMAHGFATEVTDTLINFYLDKPPCSLKTHVRLFSKCLQIVSFFNTLCNGFMIQQKLSKNDYFC